MYIILIVIVNINVFEKSHQQDNLNFIIENKQTPLLYVF